MTRPRRRLRRAVCDEAAAAFLTVASLMVAAIPFIFWLGGAR